MMTHTKSTFEQDLEKAAQQFSEREIAWTFLKIKHTQNMSAGDAFWASRVMDWARKFREDTGVSWHEAFAKANKHAQEMGKVLKEICMDNGTEIK